MLVASGEKGPKTFPFTQWFYFFVIIHMLAWTIVPALIRYNLPLDAMEGTTWGHQLEWGYDKNPFLNAWLTALAVYLSPKTGWLVYLFSQISVAACFWAVWELGKKILSPAYAFIAVLLLEGIQYYNFHAIDFNDNTLELGLWALTAYFFYQALRAQPSSRSHYSYWILTGILAALGMMAKYYTAALLVAMALFLFGKKENRKQFYFIAPYIGLVFFMMIILPHGIWLFSHDFITVRYVFERTNSEPSWFNHLFFPAQFAWQQAQVILPALFLFLLLLLGKKPWLATSRITPSHFNRDFLWYVGFGPFLLTFLLAFFSGIKLRAGWGMPLVSLWGLLLLTYVQPHLTKTKLYRFVIIIFMFMFILLSLYANSLLHSRDESSANFPGKEMAKAITQAWQETYHSKLNYVAGDRWLSGNVSFYSTDHPAVFITWNKQISPWIDIKKMQEKGAVFVWDISRHKTLPVSIQQQYPHLENKKILALSLHRNEYHLPPLLVGIAFLPPR